MPLNEPGNENKPQPTEQPNTQESSAGATPTTSTSGEAAPTSPPAAAQDTGFRYAAGDDIPDWLVGKTAKEGAIVAQQLYQQLLQVPPGQAGQAPTQPAQPAQPLTTGIVPSNVAGTPPQLQYPQYGAPPNAGQQPELDWTSDPQAAATQQMQQFYQSTVVPQMQAQQQTLAQQARQLVAVQRGDDFQRWGPEIDLALQQLQPDAWTPNNINMVVDVVRSRHNDEVVKEQAEAMLQKRIEMGELAVPAGGAAGPGQVDANVLSLEAKLDELPPNLQQRLKDLRVSESMFGEFIEQMRAPNETHLQARERWFAAADKGDIIFTDDPQTRTTEIAPSDG